MAAQHTRRMLFGAVPAAVVGASLPALAAPSRQEDFCRTLAWMHPNGELVARHIRREGLQPEQCFAIMFTAEASPAVLFKRPDGSTASVHPHGVF